MDSERGRMFLTVCMVSIVVEVALFSENGLTILAVQTEEREIQKQHPQQNACAQGLHHWIVE